MGRTAETECHLQEGALGQKWTSESPIPTPPLVDLDKVLIFSELRVSYL